MSSPRIAQESFEILDAIDRRGSFAKAAEELNRATSAISYGVQKLEEQLGITVFSRQGRRSVLTPAGQLLLEEGRIILAATARLADRAKEIANGWEVRLRIGVEATFDQDQLFPVLSAFQSEHPGIDVDVSETLLNGSWESLERGRCDLLVGAVGPVPSHKGFRVLSIGQADLVPVISRHHPLVDAVLRSGDISDVRHVVNHDTVTEDIARTEGLTLHGRPTFYVQTMEQKALAIGAGLGVGHLPRHRIQQALASGDLLPVGVEPSRPEQFLAWPLTNRGRGLQALVQQLAGEGRASTAR